MSRLIYKVKSIDWEPRKTLALSAVEADGELWLSTRTLASLFGVTTQNIQMHVRDLRDSGQTVTERLFSVSQLEGERSVTRRIKHYPLDLAHAVAIRSQRFDELNSLLAHAKRLGLSKSTYRIAPIKERAFGKLLQGALDGITTVLPQHHFPPYFIDFLLPEWRLAIEYDERHHKSAARKFADANRQSAIERSLGVEVVRVSVGREIEALNAILKIGVRIGGARSEQ